MRATCPRCAAPLETPLGCVACGSLLPLAVDPSPFEVLGLPVGYRVEAEDLRRRVLRFSRMAHPDFFATAGAEMRLLAERASALLNDANAVLSDDARRADWIVRSLGGPDENEERAMPRDFLLEVLEWNELLEAARSGEDVPDERLAGLRGELESRRAAALESLSRLLEPLPTSGSPALREARRELNVVSYVDRALGEIEALRLSREATR